MLKSATWWPVYGLFRYFFYFRTLYRCICLPTSNGMLTVYQGRDAHFSTTNKENKLSLLALLQVHQRPFLLASCHALFCTLAPSSGKLPSLHISYWFTLWSIIMINIYLTLLMLCYRCILEVQVWPLGPGGPVALQEGEVLVLPSANADERWRSDCRYAERGPRGNRLRALSGWVCAHWTDDILDCNQPFCCDLVQRVVEGTEQQHTYCISLI